MNPCPFTRITINSLALKLPPATPRFAVQAAGGVHPSSSSPCFCTVELNDCPSVPSQTSPLPLVVEPRSTTGLMDSPEFSPPANPVVFSLDAVAVQRFSVKPACIVVSVYLNRTGGSCWFSSGRMLGRVRVRVEPSKFGVVHNGWVSVGKARLFLVVRSEPDFRFIFKFGGEPECNPVVYQVPGSMRGSNNVCTSQPVFSCRFKVDHRRSTRSQSLPSESSTQRSINKLTSCFCSTKTQPTNNREQRKGWTVTIHDLFGSPVAAASMVTPFVPSPGSDRVSRSNPGCWLILRNVAGRQPSTSTSEPSWKSWGRLEAWRECSPVDALGYRVELVDDNRVGGCNNNGVLIAESLLSVHEGGCFGIDPNVVGDHMLSNFSGFVMSSSVEGEGKVSRPTVEVGVQHIACMADAAVFVALAAAVDLSMDACRLFSKRLRKELCFDEQ